MSARLRNMTLGVMLLVSLTACATTEFTSTWKDPSAQLINPAGKTVAALFVSANEAKRRAAEDTMVQAINKQGAHGVPAYSIVPGDAPKNTEQTRDSPTHPATTTGRALTLTTARGGMDGVGRTLRDT